MIVRPFFALAVAAATMGCASTSTPDPERELFDALRADGPHSELRDELMLFGQFVGVWALEIRFFDERGNVVFDGPGRWTFGWVLDGRAIQDVITYAPLDAPSKTAPGERRSGTTLRHYDGKLGTWRVVFLGATSGVLVTLTGGRVGDRIVIEGSEAENIRNRWSFNEISKDSFHWRGEISQGGSEWRLEQEVFARRVR
jgi:hypothetical protein